MVTETISQDCSARLFVHSDIDNVNIMIDGNLIGSGKDFAGMISGGIHEITVFENSERWNSPVYTDTLKVVSCDDIKLNYKFRSQVFLNSEPGDANVFVGDSLIGYTPLFIPQNIGNLRLEKKGYETRSILYSDIELNKPVQLNFVGEVSNESFIDKTLFKVLAGSMIVLGAVTAYYKLEADDSFEEYEITGDQALLDRTNKFDKISGYTFAAFQINFGILLYYILVD